MRLAGLVGGIAAAIATAAVAISVLSVLGSGSGVLGELFGSGDGDVRRSPGVRTPEYAGIDKYKRRCERINKRGAKANVVYEASKQMEVGNTEPVRASVTLDQSAPPETVLPRADATGEPGVVVSCLLQARLSGSEYEFEINESDWIERSVYARDTAEWVWDVTPKAGGDHALTLFLRPIVEVGGSEDRASQADIRTYETRVHVTVPWNERVSVLMTQTASLLNVGEGLVKAVTALIVAVSALVGALAATRKMRRSRRAAS